MRSLDSRIAKLEERLAPPQTFRRVAQILIGDQTDQLVHSAGLDRDLDRIILMKSVYQAENGQVVPAHCPAEILFIG